MIKSSKYEEEIRWFLSKPIKRQKGQSSICQYFDRGKHHQLIVEICLKIEIRIRAEVKSVRPEYQWFEFKTNQNRKN